MKSPRENGPETALCLVLFSVAGVCFAADTRQVAAIGDYTPDTDSGEIVMLAERFANHEPSRVVAPAAILQVLCHDTIYRVAVDRVKEFIEISGDAILPLPGLVRPFAVEIGIRGVVMRGGRMLLLLDFAKLPGLCDLPR